jgi:hypothetical protein
LIVRTEGDELPFTLPLIYSTRETELYAANRGQLSCEQRGLGAKDLWVSGAFIFLVPLYSLNSPKHLHGVSDQETPEGVDVDALGRPRILLYESRNRVHSGMEGALVGRSDERTSVCGEEC